MKSSTSLVLNAATSGPSEYLTLLEDAWQAHLALRTANAPTVVSLFAGCGGSSLGYSMAGYRELLAVEWDANACETFRLNFPGVTVHQGDIAALSGDEALQLAEVKPGELDVLDGSPPCQGFSTAGKRILDDPRNSLFREYVRLLRAFQPRAFVMENVSGMVKGKMRLVFVEALRELKAAGYRVSARLMNTMYFNVPQSRERMIFVGVREDIGIVSSFPKAQRSPWTVGEAWEGDIDRGGRAISDYARPIWEATPQGESLEVGAFRVLGKDRYFTHRKLSLTRVANTVQKSIGSLIYHPTEPRGLSLNELSRIASFPDGFRFTDRHQGWQRIGNSVPPLFMRAIAQHIRENILTPVLADA